MYNNNTFHPLPSGKAWREVCFLSLILLFFTACHKETKAERYAREAKETTAQCPMAIDASTVMDSMTYTATSNRFTYYYKVSGITDSLLKANEPMFRRQILDRLLNATDMLPYVQDKVSFRYVYRTGVNDTPVMDFLYESPLLQEEE